MSTVTFDYTGGAQSWVVPSQVTFAIFELYGGMGGSAGPNAGYVKGYLLLTPGETIQCNVAGGGVVSNGGWNGGGPAGNDGVSPFAVGGGGATDIRQGGTNLAARKAVAGGSGGVGGRSGGAGGAGGGNTGQAGTGGGGGAQGGGGGTQSAGGAAGTSGTGNGGPGSSGNGGYGGANGGGGGGGYFGGGGGATSTGTGGGGGGGGSNYTGGFDTSLGRTVTNTQGAAHSGWGPNGRIIITYNAPPNAPTLNTPVSNSNTDVALATTFGWTPSDPDSGDVQTQADLRWRIGSGAWTTITAASSSALASYTAAANAFAAGLNQSVEWQVRTYDSVGLVGPWSASSYFIPRTAPDALVYSSTPTITSNVVPVSGSRASNGPIAAYQIRVVNDVAGSAGSTVYADTGTVAYNNSTSLATQAPNYAYANGGTYHIQTRIQYPTGVWSAWTDSGPIVANVNAPLQPTLAVATFPASYSAVITITNPGSDPHPPVLNNLYRTDSSTGVEELIQAGLALNATYTDWTIGLNRNYGYRCEAVTATGALTSSA